MKNLLIYISNTGSFENNRLDMINDAGTLIKIQIDNSLKLGWKKSDILLVTNFNYKYRGVKALVLNDVKYFERKPQASKINAIVELFNQGLIKEDELYWFHDLDAYQLERLTEAEIDMGESEIAVTDYGIMTRWSTGVIFFRKGSRDIFEQIKSVMYLKNIDEEKALGFLTQNDQNIRKRVKKLDKSYNFTPPKLSYLYNKVIKPLRVAHFHLTGGDGRFEVKNPVPFFKGENELKIPLITKRLIKIFESHGIN